MCTNQYLNTSCKPTSQTSCYNNNVYFTDSCGNFANVYDSSKTVDRILGYWDYVAQPTCNGDPTKGDPLNCGLCSYPATSMCSQVIPGDTSPTLGNYFCRTLTCDVSKDSIFHQAA